MKGSVTIGEAFNVMSGSTPSTSVSEYWMNGKIKWVTPKDLSKVNSAVISDTERKISEGGLQSCSASIIPKNSIIISSRAPIGYVAVLGDDMACNQGCKALVPKNGTQVSPLFLYYLLNTKVEEMNRMGSGSTFKEISKSKLETIKINLPDLKTQQQIAHTLEQADAARQKRKQALALTEQFLQSAFLEMFGDPVRNEKGWEMKEIQNVVSDSLQNGAYFPKDKYTEDESEGVEMIHMSDAFYGLVKRGGMRRVHATEKEIEKYKVDHNDVLIARRSLTFEGAAKPCLIEKSNENLIFESSLIKVTPNPNLMLPIYLYFFFSNEEARKAYVLKSVTSSTISGINQSNLAATNILVPPLALQEEFAALVERVEQLRHKQRESEKELENLFGSLMQGYFG